MKTPQIKRTKDYTKFRLCQFNRDVGHTKNLRESMETWGYIPAFPLYCVEEDGFLLIKDGHHRFSVARELGIDVYYIVCNDEAPITKINKTIRSWKPRDYLCSYARLGLQDYAVCKEYHELTGIPLAQCIAILSGETANSNNHGDAFKNGAFKVCVTTYSNNMKHVVLKCREIGIKMNNTFYGALSRCLAVDKFSIDLFITRATSNPMAFKPCRTIDDQMTVFESVYNYKAQSQQKLPLVWEANEAMRKRSCIQRNSVKHPKENI